MTRNVAILVFDDVEVLDFAGPFEVFSVTRQALGEPHFYVYTVAEKMGLVTARNGLQINPDYLLNDCPAPDLLVVPGGFGTRPLLTNATVLDWIKATDSQTDHTLSVCTGSLVLGKAGLLDGLQATTHHENFDELAEIAPNVEVITTRRWVDNGHIVTAGGISAGIDMALYMVGRLLGVEAAHKTAKYMEYDWQVSPEAPSA